MFKKMVEARFLNKDIVVRTDGIHSPFEDHKTELRGKIHAAWRDRDHSAVSACLHEYLQIVGELTDDLVGIQNRLPTLQHINTLKDAIQRASNALRQEVFLGAINHVDEARRMGEISAGEDGREIDALWQQLKELRQQAEDGWFGQIEAAVIKLCSCANPDFAQVYRVICEIDTVPTSKERKTEIRSLLQVFVLDALTPILRRAWESRECDRVAKLLAQYNEIVGSLSPELAEISARLPSIRFIIAAGSFIKNITSRLERKEFTQSIAEIEKGLPPPVEVQPEDRNEVRAVLGALKQLKPKVAAAWASDLENRIRVSCMADERAIGEAQALLAGLEQVPLQEDTKRALHDKLHGEIQETKYSLFSKMMRVAYERNDWDEAIRCSAMVLEMRPQQGEAVEILAHSRKERHLEEKKQEACRYLASGQFTECTALCNALVNDEGDALKISSTVFSGTVLELLQLAQAKEEQFRRCLSDLRTATAGRNWGRIRALIDKALSLKPNNGEVLSIRTRVRRRRAVRATVTAASIAAACLTIAIGFAAIRDALDFRAIVSSFDASVGAHDYGNALVSAEAIKTRHGPAAAFIDAISARDACGRAKETTSDILFSDALTEWQNASRDAELAVGFLESGHFAQAGAAWSRAATNFCKAASFASVRVDTEPVAQGALIAISNWSGLKRIPLSSAEKGFVEIRIAPGKYRLSPYAPDYVSVDQTLTAIPNFDTKIVVSFAPRPSRLRIDSEVPAQVLQRGTVLANTGEWIPDLYPGRQRFDIVAKGFRTNSVILTIVPNRSLVHQAKLEKKQGSIRFALRPPSQYGDPMFDPDTASIRIGTNTWKTIPLPYIETGLASGEYRVQIRVKGYEVSSTDVTVRDMQTTTADLQMKPHHAIVFFATSASVPVQIFKGDQMLGNAGTPIPLMPFGVHFLELRATGYRITTMKVGPLKPGKVYTKPVHVTLEKQ